MSKPLIGTLTITGPDGVRRTLSADDEEPTLETCIVCGADEYDSCDDICYCCGYSEEPENQNGHAADKDET
jgi:ribosomal protein L37E